jgi:hypothetical protein
MAGSKERQGDFVFTANETGEYRFCFNNEMSTFAEKMVDFEIAVCYNFCTSEKKTEKKLIVPTRLKTKRKRPSPQNKAPQNHRRISLKNQFSRSPRSFLPSTETRSISEHARTAISAPYEAQRGGFSTFRLQSQR